MNNVASRPLRLDDAEYRALRAALTDAGAPEAYVFGSRTDLHRKGGDIDVLVFSSEDPFLLSHRIATRFFLDCEEKLDVVVMNRGALTSEQQAFLDTLRLVRFP